MKIEKIKNYNQKMLAILCTLSIALLLLCIVMVIIEIWPHSDYEYQPEGLIAEEKAELLNQENLRKQIISYESPWLIDTLKSTYIVPVSIKTLKKPEEVVAIDEGLLGLLDTSSSRRFKKNGYYSHKRFDGKYANLIVYDAVEDKTTSLYSERVIIGNVQAYYFQDDILMVFYTASKDTDNNGIIDLDDSRSLNVYSLNTELINKISDGDNQVTSYSFIENSKNLLVEFQLSQYNENQFDYDRSPKKIMRYDFGTQQLKNIIPDSIQNSMQKLVEGK